MLRDLRGDHVPDVLGLAVLERLERDAEALAEGVGAHHRAAGVPGVDGRVDLRTQSGGAHCWMCDRRLAPSVFPKLNEASTKPDEASTKPGRSQDEARSSSILFKEVNQIRFSLL